MKVDVHAHCYPDFYVKELQRIGAGEEGGIGIKIPEWSSAEERIAEMDDLGVDVQVLGLSAPNVYFEDRGFSRDLARMTNDFIAGICKEYPRRFLGLASVPLTSLDDAFEELNRAIDVLRMDGVLLGTNINQQPLSANQFLPFLEEVDRRKVPVALHPMRAIAEDMMPAEGLALAIPSNVGFLFETTRTIAEMTFKGTFERFKDLTFILPHAGGTIPFVYPRWDTSYRARPSVAEGSSSAKLLPEATLLRYRPELLSFVVTVYG
jgi:predicted TIM-barrel fold metal-dependent hydrolase